MLSFGGTILDSLLLGITPENLYFKNNIIQSLSTIHKPYFLSFSETPKETASLRKDMIDIWEKNKHDDSPFSYISDIGDIEPYQSFWEKKRQYYVFKVYTTESYRVPEVSDHLFFNYGLYTAEHDIPYHQRALVDLAADGKTWLFDTNGKKQQLKILVYDIELSNFIPGKTDSPIDIIGYTDAQVSFTSSKNIEKESFEFDIIDITKDPTSTDIHQLCSPSIEDEIKNLADFCKTIAKYDIISGHNIAGFDNVQLHGRIQHILKSKKSIISSEEKKIFETFLTTQSRTDKSFHFGVSSSVVQIYPCGFDTYLAARKFYPFLESHGLKAVAPFLGVGIADRLILSPTEIQIDDRTLLYNKQDLIEQMGVTLHLLQLALPLSFTTCMPFETLLSAGAVNMWDHMALIRGSVQKKIIPPICRVNSIAQVLLNDFRNCQTKKDIISTAINRRAQLPKDFIRVIKYGVEMPEWMLYPYVIYNAQASSIDERLNYHMPGGMTIKPDKDAFSHFIPWYHVVVADVGAMYPTILKALNVGADTVHLCKKNEKPDMWIWLKKLPSSFFEKQDVLWQQVSAENHSFADKGYLIGIHIDKEPGVVNQAMTGIMSMISQIKNELKEASSSGSKEELERLKMMYQSVKGARNAGTHGILAAPNVSGRQFNLWGAAAITTKGQEILDETLQYLKSKEIRVVYGDTDGLYLGCSSSANSNPSFAKALQITDRKPDPIWLTSKEKAIQSIEESNKKWQKNLNYPDFELEPEVHDAMIFVKHKNYLIFDEKNQSILMQTKGNNFKGSDKANIARIALKEIMFRVLKDIPSWSDEEEARAFVQEAIQKHTQDVVSSLDFTKVDIKELTLIQSVKPSTRYKRNQDGSLSTFGRRAAALEHVINEKIKSSRKIRFVVTKKPLPGISNPSKSGVKPIDYMYPVDFIKSTNDIDLQWYQEMIENYIKGAFGLSQMQKTEQTGLDAWM